VTVEDSVADADKRHLFALAMFLVGTAVQRLIVTAGILVISQLTINFSRRHAASRGPSATAERIVTDVTELDRR